MAASLVLAALLAAGATSSIQLAETALKAAASVSPRPSQCSSPGLGSESWLWSEIGRPKLKTYCRLLAAGQANLSARPALALDLAVRAQVIQPGDDAAQLLRARALRAAGAVHEAWKAFLGPWERSGGFENPAALHDFAVTALATGHYDQCVSAYRWLVPRATLLGHEPRRQRAMLEAAFAVMYLGESGTAEAVTYLTELQRGSVWPGLEKYVSGALALALDRQGRRTEARGVAEQIAEPWGLDEVFREGLSADAAGESDQLDVSEGPGPPSSVRSGASKVGAELAAGAPIVVTRQDLGAVIATLAEVSDRDLAREHWETYLATAHGVPPVWLAHARSKLGQLRRRGRQPR